MNFNFASLVPFFKFLLFIYFQWAKGYAHLGLCLYNLVDFDGSMTAYKKVKALSSFNSKQDLIFILKNNLCFFVVAAARSIRRLN